MIPVSASGHLLSWAGRAPPRVMSPSAGSAEREAEGVPDLASSQTVIAEPDRNGSGGSECPIVLLVLLVPS